MIWFRPIAMQRALPAQHGATGCCQLPLNHRCCLLFNGNVGPILLYFRDITIGQTDRWTDRQKTNNCCAF